MSTPRFLEITPSFWFNLLVLTGIAAVAVGGMTVGTQDNPSSSRNPSRDTPYS